MKNLLFISLVFPLAFIFSGCQPEPVVKFAILATSSSNGALNPSGNVNVNSGTDATFAITPQDGYVVKELKADGKVVPSAPSFTFYKVNANHKLEVTFKERDKEKFLVEASASIGGTISPASVEVIKSGSATFNTTTNVGYILDSLIVDGKAVLALNNSYTLSNITADHKIRVVFKEIAKFTITSSAGTHGAISPTTSVYANANTPITILADTGYMIDVLIVDGKNVTIPITNAIYGVDGLVKTPPSVVKFTHTFYNVNADHTISATFKRVDVYFYATDKPWCLDLYQDLNRDSTGGWILGSWSDEKVISTINEVYYFQPDGRLITYWAGKRVGNCAWWIDYKTNTPSLKTEGSSSIEQIDAAHMMTLNFTKHSRAFYSHH